jgi:exodeoxyribonuclease V alpha subunit
MEAVSDGHCGLPRSLLLKKAESLLAIPDSILNEALNQEIKENSLIEDKIGEDIVIFLGAYYTYEKNIALKLKRIARDKPLWHTLDYEKAIAWVEHKLSIELADNQKEAIRQAVTSKFTVITGGPGTGKTTLLNSLLNILLAKKYKVLLCAPTGRAAKRLSETTGKDAYTIHRLLKFNPSLGKFEYNQDNPLDCDLLIVDESSMVDVQLMNSLLKALPDSAALILVGDVDQLPSVGAGQVLKDIIDSQKFNVVKLTQIFRQAQNSDIILNAHKINQGLMPNLTLSQEREGDTDFYFINATTPEDTVNKVIELVAKRIPAKFHFNPIKDIQVLCPMQIGGCGAISLNVALQNALNSNIEHSVTKYGQRYAINDKVMQTENNYDKDVYNGDIGTIKAIDPIEQEVIIEFDDRDISYNFNELDELTLAYAITIHKSQGSEYPVVVVPIVMQHYMMLRKNLLYTGITRGKKLVVMVGEKKAISIAIKSRGNTSRYSKLCDLLCIDNTDLL